MAKQQECDRCGVIYTDEAAHQRFHEQIDAWMHLVELEIDHRMRAERRREA